MNNGISLYTIMNDVETIKSFVAKVNECEGDVTIRSADNHYSVDAKSIMGVLSLVTARPVCIRFESKDDYELMEPFIHDNLHTVVVCAC